MNTIKLKITEWEPENLSLKISYVIDDSSEEKIFFTQIPVGTSNTSVILETCAKTIYHIEEQNNQREEAKSDTSLSDNIQTLLETEMIFQVSDLFPTVTQNESLIDQQVIDDPMRKFVESILSEKGLI